MAKEYVVFGTMTPTMICLEQTDIITHSVMSPSSPKHGGKMPQIYSVHDIVKKIYIVSIHSLPICCSAYFLYSCRIKPSESLFNQVLSYQPFYSTQHTYCTCSNGRTDCTKTSRNPNKHVGYYNIYMSF